MFLRGNKTRRIGQGNEGRDKDNREKLHLADCPKDKGIIRVKRVFKTNLNLDGSIQKHNARLVAKGYSQQLGVD